LQGAALVACADSLPGDWAAFAGVPANTDSLDVRLLAVDVAELPPWETARRTTNLLLACVRDAGIAAEIGLRICCDHDPVGQRLTTHAGAVFTTIGLPLRPADPRGDAAMSAWVESALYDANGLPFADPAVRWVVKLAPQTVGPDWLQRNEDGGLEHTRSGALVGPPPAAVNPSATFTAGEAWRDIRCRVWVTHGGGRLRVHLRQAGEAAYAAEIGATAVRLLHVAAGAETELATRALAYPGNEFLRLDFSVVGDELALVIDGLSIFERVAAGGQQATGTIGLAVVEPATGSGRVRFDELEVVRLSGLGVEAETLLAEPFTGQLPAAWQFVDGGQPWAVEPTGHPRMDLGSLVNLRLKIDYLHEMVELAS
jgi:hypothetical protein